MTYKEFCDKIHAVLPDATIGEDNDGQLVIYTNLKEDTRGIQGDDEEEDRDSRELIDMGDIPNE